MVSIYVLSAPVAVLTQPGAKIKAKSSRDELPKAECFIQQQIFSKTNSKDQSLPKLAKRTSISSHTHTMQKLAILAEIASKHHSGGKSGRKTNQCYKNFCCMHHLEKNTLCQPKSARTRNLSANHHVMTTTANTKDRHLQSHRKNRSMSFHTLFRHSGGLYASSHHVYQK